MTTSLNEPFRDKTEAKQGGAQPDSEASKWFLPIGCDLEPFTTAARQSEHACQGCPCRRGRQNRLLLVSLRGADRPSGNPRRLTGKRVSHLRPAARKIAS